MAKDDRFYAFIIARTSSRRIRRVFIRPGRLKAFAIAFLTLILTGVYGLYGLTQQPNNSKLAVENERLRTENDIHRSQLKLLQARVDRVENASKRLAEMVGADRAADPSLRGTGGPTMPVSLVSMANIVKKTTTLEQDLVAYESLFKKRVKTPSIWPVYGTTTDSFGARRDPFGGSSFEFHSGHDISAPWGAPVVAAGSGTIKFAGWQNGYGNTVDIDHGNGLTTRYGHMSRLNVVEGELVKRGDLIGRVGSTGRSTGPHLHYEVRKNDHPVDPRKYLPKNNN
jgi:murein DD-endopeptidase MepM/ murein hydrolase activator NlpD